MPLNNTQEKKKDLVKSFILPQILEDVRLGDTSAIYDLLAKIYVNELVAYLPENQQFDAKMLMKI